MPATACGPASCRQNARRKVVERLMAPDMWSGWGIRTLSALNPAFNPYNYQTGSVWPHDNGIIALRFQTLWVRRGGSPHRPRYQRGRHPFSVEPASRTLHDASSATRPRFPSSMSAPTCRKPGRRARCSAFCRRSWASCQMRRVTSCTSIRCCPRGYPTSPCSIFALARIGFDIRFWREGENTEFKVLRGGPCR